MRWRREGGAAAGAQRALHDAESAARKGISLRRSGFPVAPFRVVQSEAELRAAVAELGCPCVLKTADFGYDGKGQQKITYETDLAAVWKKHGAYTGVLEAWVPFAAELSVVVARGDAAWGRTRSGRCIAFPPTVNEHENHILATSVAPAPLADSASWRARSRSRRPSRRSSMSSGLLAVEFFLTKRGDLLVNELAPRPHNSGHYSFDACVTSQFEQQLRAVCGLPLGDTRLLSPVLMRNLLGDVWANGTPDWSGASRAARPAAASLRQERAARRAQDGPLLRAQPDDGPGAGNRRAGAEDFGEVARGAGSIWYIPLIYRRLPSIASPAPQPDYFARFLFLDSSARPLEIQKRLHQTGRFGKIRCQGYCGRRQGWD